MQCGESQSGCATSERSGRDETSFENSRPSTSTCDISSHGAPKGCTSDGDNHHRGPRGQKHPKPGTLKESIKVEVDDVLARNPAGENFDLYYDSLVQVSDLTLRQNKLNSFRDGKLHQDLLDVLEKYNYAEPTPIQKYAIPVIAAGRDLVVCCQTGSGKTAAYLLPIANELISGRYSVAQGKPQRPLAIIMAPTRELATQLTKDLKIFLMRSDVQVCECLGGIDVNQERRNIMRGAHIIIATMGRIMQFLREKVLSLDRLRYFVLDEADEMLQGDFGENVALLLSKTQRKPQVIMFSATFSPEIADIAAKHLQNYVEISVGIVGVSSGYVEQEVLAVPAQNKLQMLKDILFEEFRAHPQAKVLVFLKTKRRVNWLYETLHAENPKISYTHSDRTPEDRQRAVSDFNKGVSSILLATSVLARGLDIGSLSLVVTFDLPPTIDKYVNQIGRTGRIANTGRSVAFYDPQEDAGLALDLYRCLLDAGITPPPFLCP